MTRTTALVETPTEEERAVLARSDLDGLELEPDGTEGIAPSFPIVKIVQGTSSMDGAGKHGGDFWHSDSEEFEGTIDVVALLMRHTQAFFPRDAVEPACSSSDGVSPRPNQPLWRSAVVELANGGITDVPEQAPAYCRDCPFSLWIDDQPPPCRASVMLLVERADGSLAQLRVGGKSMQPWRRFVSRRLAPKQLPLYTQRLHLYTEERSEPGKKWFELRVDAQPLTRAEVARNVALLRAERQRFEASVAAAAQEADEERASNQPAGQDDWLDGTASFVDPD